MHNKSFTVDNQATILGGRNIGDEYFSAAPDFNFNDMDVLAIGPAARDVSKEFDLYWNSDLAYPVSVLTEVTSALEDVLQKTKALNEFVTEQSDSPYLEALRNSDLAEKMRSDQINFEWGKYEVIYDLPEKILQDKSETADHLINKIKPYLEQLKEELIIISPYFVPGKNGVATLTSLVKRGIRVRVLTNSLSSEDYAIIHSGYAKYRKDLLRGGVEIYELNKKLNKAEKKAGKDSAGSPDAGLHAKSFVFDRSRVFIGSLNMDPQSVKKNTEMGVVITQAEMAQSMGDWLDVNINKIAFRVELVTGQTGGEHLRWRGYENGEEVIFTKEPYTGFWTRFYVGFLRIFPIDSML